MAPGRTKRDATDHNASAVHNASLRPGSARHVQQPSTASDFDLDVDSDAPGNANTNTLYKTMQPTPRTNAELNLAVLRRHYPDVASILSIAPYAVVYLFSNSTQSWEKSGVEGTMFVCQLHTEPHGGNTEERYAVIIMNRRGLENLEVELRSEEDVDVTDEYIILQGTTSLDTEEHRRDDAATQAIYGVWVFTEPAPSSTSEMRAINTKVILDCAARARASRQHLASHNTSQPAILTSHGSDPEATNMARQLSLREMFSKSREESQGQLYSNTGAGSHGSVPFQQYEPSVAPNILDSLFQRAGTY